MDKSNNNLNEAKWVSLKSFKDEATYNKIHLHLTDINDTISEDDIRNVKIYSYNIEIKSSNKSTSRKK